MKRRRVPDTISKRLRRKLRRSKNPYLLWLRLRRPAIYTRLVNLGCYQLFNTITNISPSETPYITFMGRIDISDWKVDNDARQT